MEKRSRNVTQGGADLAQAAREYANKVWLNFDKEYENLISNKEHEGLFPKDLLIWQLIHKAYEKGAAWQKQRLIDKSCVLYCKFCDTKECVDDECNWVKKFRKSMEK